MFVNQWDRIVEQMTVDDVPTLCRTCDHLFYTTSSNLTDQECPFCRVTKMEIETDVQKCMYHEEWGEGI